MTENRDNLSKLHMLGLSNKDGWVLVRFPANGDWMTLSPSDARKFAQHMLDHAAIAGA